MLERINSKHAQIWCARVSAESPSDYWDVLSDSEQSRAKRFKFKKDHDAFVVSHGILRKLLAAELDQVPNAINFSSNDYGKPFVNEPLYFNISHSKDMVLFALCDKGPVGIDVEFMRAEIRVRELAERFFSGYEQKQIFALPESKQLRAFYQCWSRKEAFIKAIGKGLSFSLNKFDVEIGLGSGSLLREVRDSAYSAAEWLLTDLPVDSSYAAAISSPQRFPSYKKSTVDSGY